MLNTHRPALTPTSRAVIHLTCALVACGPWLPAMAAPSQKTLLNRAAGKTDPNIVYVIDDSGSMSFSHAPDNVWAGGTGNSPTFPIFHPNDDLARKPSFVPSNYQIRRTCVVRTDVNAGSLGTTNLRLRSSQFNKIYYNPAVRYRPWAKANPTDPDFGNASFTAARIDPRYILNTGDTNASSAVVNLSSVATTSGSVPTAPYSSGTNPQGWCTQNAGTNTAPGSFNPAVYFRFKLDPATATSTQINDTANYVLVNLNGTESAFLADAAASTKSPRRTDCTSRNDGKCSLAEEQQNFANWFTYYRTRSLLARGATSLAFSKLNDPFRLGYGQINYSGSSVDGITGAPAKTLVAGVRDFTINSTPRANFFSWLYKVPYYGGTPLRRALDDVGRYYSLSDSKGPWGKNPGTGTEDPLTHLSCRKSYSILMTDGYWNSDAASATVNDSNWDQKSGSLIADNRDGRTYQYDYNFTDGVAATPPYMDGNSGTLADVAQYYWMTDLRTDIKNNLPVDMYETNPKKPFYSAAKKIDRLDHAFWQHMTTFTVGLGITGTKDPASGAPPSGGWPTPVADGATAVDDLWHAAVNGRGKYLSASNPQEFQDALDETLSEIFASQTAPSGVAVSSFVITAGSKKYVPSFAQPQWTGDITAYDAKSSNSILWKATAQLPSPASRNITIWNGTQAVAFDTTLASGMRAATLWGLASDATDNLINFLRGDRTNEGTAFRCRGDTPGTTTCSTRQAGDENRGLIGDVVNSMPTLVKGNLDMSYQFLPSSDPGRNTYRTYVGNKKKRSTGVLFFGANDGMLHALNDATGQEIFAFIPKGVIGNLARLSLINYGGTTDETASYAHRYYVDGPLTEADAYLNGAWTNLLIGTTGAGGKSIFAIKVDTNSPTSLSTSSVMWEISGDSGSNYAEKNKLGYVTSPVSVGRMADGNWYAVFGNGLDSTDGKAYLMMVNLATGATTTIQAGTGSGNGLGGVTLVRNTEQVVVAAYAGDALGNLWRFDLESATPGNWKVGLSSQPLYTGSSSKPITAAPTYMPHPLGGLMVLFGTGKLYASGDESNTAMQSLYGVWDPTQLGQPSATTVSASSTDLVAQTINTTKLTSTTGNYYTISQNSVTWKGTGAKRGWFINLNLASGLRDIYDPFLLNGLAFFNTIAPTTPNDDCDPVSSVGYTLIIDPLTGGMPKFAMFDVNGDGHINSSDALAGIFEGEGNGRLVPTIEPIIKGPDDPPGDPCGNNTPITLTTSGAGAAVCSSKQYTQRYWRQIQNFPR